MTNEVRLKRFGGITKHVEFMIIPSEQTDLDVRPFGTDIVVTSIKRLSYVSALLSTSADVIMSMLEDGIAACETTNVLVIGAI